MKTISVAFDVDGTLISNGALSENDIVPNERIRNLLIIMAHMKNVKIIVWSGGGELWARQAARAIGIEKYVHQYASKNIVAHTKTMPPHPIFQPDIKPDIAIDDIQSCELGMINLIVREK